MGPIYRATLACLVLSLFATLAYPQDLEQMTESSEFDVQLLELDGVDTERGLLLVESAILDERNAPRLEFAVELYAPRELGEVQLELHAFNRAGESLSTHRVETRDIDGVARTRFEWRLHELPEGDYRIFVEAYDRTNRRIAWRSYGTRKLSWQSLNARIERARAAVSELRSFVRENLPELLDSEYAQLRGTMAQYSLERAEAALADNWNDAYAFSGLAIEIADSLRAQITFGMDRPEIQQQSTPSRFAQIAPPELENTVFPFGLSLDAQAAPDLEIMEALGLKTLFRREDALPHQPGSWTTLQNKREIPFARNVATHPVPVFDPDEFLTAFQRYVEDVYPDRRTVNRLWRKRLFAFDEIGIWPEETNPAYQWDLQYFTRLQTRAWLGQLTAASGSEDRVAKTVTLAQQALEPGNARTGLSPIDVAQAGNFTSLELSGRLADPVFGLAIHRRAFLITLMRSLNPNAPLLVRDTPTLNVGHAFDRDLRQDLYTLAWETVMWGADGLMLDGWTNRSDPGYYLFYPAAIEGYVTAARDINRLAPVLQRFQNAPPTVGILWSEPSRIYKDGGEYLASVADAFEGAASSGYDLRFVTEEDVANGALEDLEILIIPDTPAVRDGAFIGVREFVDNGGAAIRAEQTLTNDERGVYRPDTVVFTNRLYIVRAGERSTEYLEGLDALRSIPGISQTPRAVNPFGFPLEGVHTRFIEHEGVGYLYLANLRKDAVTCYLDGAAASEGTDLITGQPITFPFLAPPLQPKLIRLDKHADTPEPAATTD